MKWLLVPNQWSEQNGRYHFNDGRWEKDVSDRHRIFEGAC